MSTRQSETPWIVEIQSGCWLATWSGDPGRTLVLSNARRYPTIQSATYALAVARGHRQFLDAKIYQLPTPPRETPKATP